MSALAVTALGLTFEGRRLIYLVGIFVVFSLAFAVLWRAFEDDYEEERLLTAFAMSFLAAVAWPFVPVLAAIGAWVWLLTRPGPVALRRRRLATARQNVARLERELGLDGDDA